jgi:hypothetical protein
MYVNYIHKNINLVFIIIIKLNYIYINLNDMDLETQIEITVLLEYFVICSLKYCFFIKRTIFCSFFAS